MYRITNVDPPAVQSLLPGCPSALAGILNKALAKDREVRYRNFEDLQFDAEPVLIDLKRERASELASDVRRLLDAGDITAANTVVRSMLELDPSNREARQFREAIQEQLQWRAVKPRVEALVKGAEESLAQRQFPEALEMFESALKLDNGDTSIRIRMEQARAAYEQSRRAEQLLAEAQNQVKRQDLTAAHRSAAEALRNDPQNPQVGQLLERINQEIEKREQQRQLQQNLATASQLLASGNYETAESLLIDLNLRHPRTPAITALLAQAQSMRADVDRRQRLRTELDGARELVQNGGYKEAIRRLERLTSEFSHDESFIALLGFARDGLKGQVREEKLRRTVEQARSLLARESFAAAIELLVEAVRDHPGDESVSSLLDESLRLQAADSRQREISRVAARADNLRRSSRFADALELVESGLHEHADAPELLSLRTGLVEELEQQKRNQAVSDAKAGADGLLRAGRPVEALELLTRTMQFHGATGELADIMGRAQAAQREKERAALIEQRVAAAASLDSAGRSKEALAQLEGLLREYPGVDAIGRALRRVQENIAAGERRGKIEIAVRKIDEKLEKGDWNAALRLIAEAQSSYGDDERFGRSRLKAIEGQGVAEEIERKAAQQAEAKQRTEARTGAAKDSRAEAPKPKSEPAAVAGRGTAAEEFSATRILSQNTAKETTAAPPKTPAAPTGQPLTPELHAVEPRRKSANMWIVGVAAATALLAGGAWFALHKSSVGDGTPTNPASWTVSPASLVFRYQQKGPGPDARPLTLSGSAGQTLTARTSAPWITLQPGTVQTSGPGSTSEVQVSIAAGELAPGNYSGTVEFQSDAPGSKPRTISVKLDVLAEPAAPVGDPPVTTAGKDPGTKTVTPEPFLNITPSSLQLQTRAGAVSESSLAVQPGRGSKITLAVKPGSDWLTASAAQDRTGFRVQIRADATRLSPGSYSGVVTLSSSGLTKTVPVSFTVDPVPVTKGGGGQPQPKQGQDSGAATNRPPQPKFSLDTYGGPRSGTLRWQGDLPPGGRLTIQDGTAATGSIRGGRWEPGVPIAIEQLSPAAVQVVQPPTEANQWTVVVTNRGSSSLDSVSITWKVKEQ
jgi:hypothetical protein